VDHLRSIRALKRLNELYVRAFHDLKVLSPPRLPETGPAILVCNHTSGIDPFLIQSVCPRVVTWMMAKEFYDIGVFTWAFKLIGAIPVTRSGRDSAATRAAIRALKDGQVLGIFPEGRIENARELLSFQTGVALMAIRTDVPVYPAYLDGEQRNKDMLQGLHGVQQRHDRVRRFGPVRPHLDGQRHAHRCNRPHPGRRAVADG
jgi:1-acyl-sn-glycerol-3-phosphate acyltransferase